MMAVSYLKSAPGFYLSRLLPLALFAATGVAVCAQTTQQQQQQDVTTIATDLSTYNLISFGNASFTSFGDTQGALAVNGDLSLTGGSIATNNTSIISTLYVTGQLTLSGTTMLSSGFASLPGLTPSHWSWNATQQTLTGGGGALNSTNAGNAGSHPSNPNAGNNPIYNPTPGWNWTTLRSSLGAASTSLAGATATGTIGVNSQNLEFTTNLTSGVAVFTLNANLLSGNTYNGQTFSNIQINVPTGLTYVVNVINAGGKTIFGSGANFNSGSNDNQLLWNIEGSGTVTISNGGNFYGAILAPAATIDSLTVVNGQVASNGFSDSNVELHDTQFSPAAVTTPEPATYALWAAGICGAAIALRRRVKFRVRAALPA